MKTFFCMFLSLFMISFLMVGVAGATNVNFNWVYDTPPSDLKEFQLYQINDVGVEQLISTVGLNERSVIVDVVLNDVNNKFGLVAVDDGGLKSGMVVCNLGVPPGDIDQFSVIIVVSGVN